MTEQSEEPRLAGLLKRLVEECPHPARLIELLYWSAEHELAEVMRRYIGLAPDVRAALHDFLMLAKDEPGSVTARIARNGELTLSSPAAAELARKLGCSPSQVDRLLDKAGSTAGSIRGSRQEAGGSGAGSGRVTALTGS